jgi:hypothetical protein
MRKIGLSPLWLTPIFLWFLALLASRLCSFNRTGRYCSPNETWLWIVDRRGWLLLLAIGAFVAFFWWLSSLGNDNDKKPDSHDVGKPE